jgi:N,N'-diacetyllegionaminate synthase
VDRVRIGSRDIGAGEKVFAVAEAGVNHCGDLDTAKALIDAAASAGADAIKFQTFKADRMVSPMAPKAQYQLDRTNQEESQLDMLRPLELSFDAHRELQRQCERRGIEFLSTPFDTECVDFLDELGVQAFKIGSGEVTNLPFLRYVGAKGKPMILSTGMSHLGEVWDAVRAIRDSGCDRLILLHCVSNYPADPGDVNLRAMETMKHVFGVPVGLSDHTLGIEVAIASVALGASLIEKHFTLDKTLPGPDHSASLEQHEMEALVRGIRKIEKALGHGRKEPAASEYETAAVARRSLVAAIDIPADTMITEEMIEIKRPGTGLPSKAKPYLIGRTARSFIPAGTVLTLEMLR